MKIFKKILVLTLCLVLGATPFFTACGEGGGAQDQCTISFYQDSASAEPFDSMKVKKGTVPDISGVTAPDKAGEKFVDWTDARNSSTPYDRSQAVEGDLELFGMWSPNPGQTVKVIFNLNYSGSTNIVKEGPAGSALDFPEVTRTNYTFKGWFNDKDCQTPYDSLNYPQSNTTLYAKWEVNSDAVEVTYMLGDEVFAQKAVIKGGKAEDLACDPYDYVFLGWLDKNGSEYNFGAAVNDPLTLRANYYSKGLEVEDGEVWGYDDDTYGKNIVVPAIWYGDDGAGEPVEVKIICDLSGLDCETIVLAEGIEEIEKSAFADCQSLTKVVIPSTVTYIGTGAFRGCESLVEKSFAGNDTLQVQDGIILGDDGKTALLYIGDKVDGTLTIPATVTKIDRYAFSYANINKLVVPATVTAIEANAFSNSLIREAEINCSQTFLPQSAFEESTLLKTVTLAAGITTIQSRAFYDCASLSTVNIQADTINLRNNAFYYCSSLESFPFDKIGTLGESVFAYAGIKTYSFKEGATEVAVKQFENWNNLTEVTLPSSIQTIGESAFDGCEALATLNIDDGSELKEIGARAFAGTKLQSLDLTACESLATIGANAFYNCASLTSVKLPSNLSVIGSAAFWGCSALEELSIPFVGSYNYEGYRIFFEEVFMRDYCTSIAYSLMAHNGEYYYQKYKEDPEGFADEYMTNPALREWYELHKEGKKAEYDKKNLTEIFSTASLFGYIFGGNAYQGGVLIQQFMDVVDSGSPQTYSFYIPESLKKITLTGETITACAFNSMLSYTGTFEFTDKLTDIGARAFSTQTAIPAFDFSTATNLKNIGSNAFANCRGLTEVVLPDSLEVVGASSFRGCSNLATVQVPVASSEKPLVLGAYAFGDCSNLSKFYAKGETTEEGTFKFNNVNFSNYSFLNCGKLKVVESAQSVGFIMGWYGTEGAQLQCNAFYTDSLVEVKFPENAANFRYVLPENAGATPEALKQQGFVDKCIPGRLFYGCGGLKKFNATADCDVVIPEGITAIGPFAFQAYTGPSVANMSIKTIKFPQSLKTVMEGAFGHTDIEEVDASMIEDLSSGFDYANKLKKIYLNENVTLTPMVLRSTASLKTVALKNNAGDVVKEAENVVYLPNGTTEIPDYAFQNSGIEKIVLAEGIETIGHYSFFGDEELTTVELPQSLTYMDDGAFERCFKLTDVKFAETNNLKFINDHAFQYCTSLQSIDIPEGVVYLGTDAFSGAIKLEKITLPSTLFYAGGASIFCNCLSLKEVVLFGSVPPQIDFDIADTTYAYSAFNIVDQVALASIPAHVAAELAEVDKAYTQNPRTMTENLKEFKEYFVQKNGLKIYIPEDAKAMYEENIANALRVTGGNSGKAQRRDFGWFNYKEAFVTYESGVYAEQGKTDPVAFYIADDDSSWVKVGSAAYTDAAAAGYTYDGATNTLSKGGTQLKSIGGLYMDVTATYSKGSSGTTDADARLMQFRPQLVIGADGKAAMFVYDGSKASGDDYTQFIPNMYYGTYTLSWEGATLTVTLNFTELTTMTFKNNDAEINAAAVTPVTFTLTEKEGAFASETVTGTKLGDSEIVFTRGCVAQTTEG